MKIILDTNFLMVPITLNIDIFEGLFQAVQDSYELLTIDLVVKELEYLSKKKELKTIDRKAAKFGLSILKQKNLKIEHSSLDQHTDDALINKAIKFKDKGFSVAIATIDKDLIRKAHEQSIKVLSVKQKKNIYFQ